MRREIATTRPIPEDRGANVVIFNFCDDEEMAGESQDRSPQTEPMALKDRGP